MFGYVVADAGSLSETALQRYRSCYCGLCRTIGEHHGTLQRAALTYDMTFLVLLLSSLYEPNETENNKRCLVHPLSQRTYHQSEVTVYAAAMNMALAYHNCMDDWHDDKAIKSAVLASVFRKSAHSVQNQYPRQWQAIETCIETLQQIEAENLQEPDRGAAAFGALMAEVLVWKEDRWAVLLRQLGNSLGQFIYLLDALLDLPKDIQSGAYNPFTSRQANGLTVKDYLPVLQILMGQCSEAMERLPLIRDLDLIRNILYSGIWTAYHRFETQSGKEENHV